MVVLLLRSDHLEVEQVALQLPVAGGRVPSGWRDNFKASEFCRLFPGGRVQHIERKARRRSSWQDEVRRGAVNRLWSCPLFLHHVPCAHGVQEAQAGAIDTIVGVAWVDGLEEVSDMADVDASLAHRVRLLHHLHQAALLQTLHSLEFSKVVKGIAIKLEREAGAMAGILPVKVENNF